MSFHGAFHLLLTGAGVQVQLLVEGVELEVVAVRFSGRRTGTVVSDFSEVIAALVRSLRKSFLPGNPFGKVIGLGRKVVQNPMSPGSGGCVGIIGDKSEIRGAGRHILPGKFGRDIRPVTGEFLRNITATGETLTGESKGHGVPSLKRGTGHKPRAHDEIKSEQKKAQTERRKRENHGQP